MEVAVYFQAPPWADYITGISLYISNDQIEDPENPNMPTTLPFTLCVWRPTPYMLPGVRELEFTVGGGYGEDTWLEVVLPEPVYISDYPHFPDKQFFAGFTWLHPVNPVPGLDDNLPLDGTTFMYAPDRPAAVADAVRRQAAGHRPDGWIPLVLDLYVEVIVSDEPTVVHHATWSSIKALFR